MSELAQPFVRARRRAPLLAAAAVVAGLVALSPRLSGVDGNTPEPQRAVARQPTPLPHGDGCGTSDRGTVYELAASAPGGAAAGTAWIAPASGSWRVQEGVTQAVVCGSSFSSTTASGTYLRRGLTRDYLGERARLTVADAVALYAAGRTSTVVQGHTLELAGGGPTLRLRLDGRPFLDLRVLRTLTPASAREEGLFAIDTRAAASSDVELAPGSIPSVPVTAYWLGPKDASGASEHRALRPQDDLVTTSYGALQVRSEPAVSAQARRDLALYRTWPATRVVLASGARATLYAFRGAAAGRGLAVLAGQTLVTVLGAVPAREAADLATQLRALPAPLAAAAPGAR